MQNDDSEPWSQWRARSKAVGVGPWYGRTGKLVSGIQVHWDMAPIERGPRSKT